MVIMKAEQLALLLVADPVIREAATKIAPRTPVVKDVIKHKLRDKTTDFLEHALLTKRHDIKTRIVEKTTDPQCCNLVQFSVLVTSIPAQVIDMTSMQKERHEKARASLSTEAFSLIISSCYFPPGRGASQSLLNQSEAETTAGKQTLFFTSASLFIILEHSDAF